MSKKNFKVATDKGQTPTQDTKHIFATANIKKDKTPTGKVKTLKDKEALKKEREEQYKNFRIGALKRRAKRMGLSEEQTKVKIEELIKQIDTPNQYLVLVMFDAKDKDMNTQALKNEGIVWKMQGPTHFYIEADQDTLGTIRGIMTPGSKIHPYVKKKPPILPVPEPSGRGEKKRTKAEKKALAAAAKAVRKEKNIRMHRNKKTGEIEHRRMSERPNRHSNPTKGKAIAKMKKRIKLLEAKKARKATTIQLNAKKRSTGSKKSSTMKKAA